MNIEDRFLLVDMLNYDTNVKQVFTAEQRILVHQQISRLIRGAKSYKFSPVLNSIVVSLEKEFKRTKYTAVKVRIGQDRIARRV